MRAYYAIVEQEGDSAYGVSFPDFPSVFSAADEEDDIVVNAIEALRLWAEDEELPAPTSLHELQARQDVRQALAAGAFLVRVPLIENDTRIKRANITFETGMLRAIDETAQKRGLTRSAFLASCARKEIEATA
ncbi:type II toxin-antitoxin system HicB family antitoxin [Pseudochelatococcus sp. G4_1912]|uniref:type II toxin-antitoxin system HicB family antitoxin n=1 Tax=Pseudochelatococcus sp. G4_1912 TaxID=3114288 RepID=UPI0039C5D7E4